MVPEQCNKNFRTANRGLMKGKQTCIFTVTGGEKKNKPASVAAEEIPC